MKVPTPEATLGWEAPPFSLSDPDGVVHTFESIAGKNGTVVAFLCNHCPYVQAIIDPFVATARTLQEEGFGVVALMSNDFDAYPEDAPEAMKVFAHQHRFCFPYLVDVTQTVARAYDAVCTPDFFGFDAQKRLFYRGRSVPRTSTGPCELLEAMRRHHKGLPSLTQHPCVGCSIKWRSS